MLNPERPMSLSGVPRFEEVVELGLGHWLKDPASVHEDRVFVE
jgi:hypothetical protein